MTENKNAKTPTDDGQPVAWLKTWSDGSLSVLKTKSPSFADHELEPLYTEPPKREWVGLTDEERSYYLQSASNVGWWQAAKMIEAKLKEKNT